MDSLSVCTYCGIRFNVYKIPYFGIIVISDGLSKKTDNKDAEVVWEGDSLEVIRAFPDEVRGDLGAELRRLQVGTLPLVVSN